mmetsp:Transcript_28404/g.41868  ORF Transcript_28404/g.41868 Transcript_28404/m.41868 type:complete len:98 (-) Transcript_28404:298-591(-)
MAQMAHRSPPQPQPQRQRQPQMLRKSMLLGSKGTIGALLASSFCERINSAANLVVTTGNSLLGTDEINMLVTLRMNRGFMQFMKRHYVIPDHLLDGA